MDYRLKFSSVATAPFILSILKELLTSLAASQNLKLILWRKVSQRMVLQTSRTDPHIPYAHASAEATQITCLSHLSCPLQLAAYKYQVAPSAPAPGATASAIGTPFPCSTHHSTRHFSRLSRLILLSNRETPTQSRLRMRLT